MFLFLFQPEDKGKNTNSLRVGEWDLLLDFLDPSDTCHSFLTMGFYKPWELLSSWEWDTQTQVRRLPYLHMASSPADPVISVWDTAAC